MDVYDTLLTQAEIQGNISQVNDMIKRKKAEEACKHGKYRGMVRKLNKVLCCMFLFYFLALTVHKTLLAVYYILRIQLTN